MTNTATATAVQQQVTAADISYDGQRIELESGWYAIVKTEYDENMGAPWKEHDGHGEVSEWRHYDPRDGDAGKRSGERVLCRDGRSARFYDFARAVETARKDGWGCSHWGDGKYPVPLDTSKTRENYAGHTTAREMAACAADQDFRFLQRWCNGDWQWISVIVTLFDADGAKVDHDALSGIESDGDYWKVVAAEIVNTLAGGVCAANEVSL